MDLIDIDILFIEIPKTNLNINTNVLIGVCYRLGVENTLLNWSNTMVYISVLLSVNMWVSGCNKGPIAFV